MEFNCKLRHLVDNLIEYGVTEITMRADGLGIGLVDLLRAKGVKVNITKRKNVYTGNFIPG